MFGVGDFSSAKCMFCVIHIVFICLYFENVVYKTVFLSFFDSSLFWDYTNIEEKWVCAWNLRCSQNACMKVDFHQYFGLNSRQNHLWLYIIFLWLRNTLAGDTFSFKKIHDEDGKRDKRKYCQIGLLKKNRAQIKTAIKCKAFFFEQHKFTNQDICK